jgi:hypothetical protein
MMNRHLPVLFALLVALMMVNFSCGQIDCPSFVTRTIADRTYSFTNTSSPQYTWDQAQYLCTNCLQTKLANIPNRVVIEENSNDRTGYWIGQYDGGEQISNLIWFTGTSPTVNVLSFDPDVKANVACEANENFGLTPVGAVAAFTDMNMDGYVEFYQGGFMTPLQVYIHITDFPAGMYALRVSTFGDIRSDCAFVGPVFDSNSNNMSMGNNTFEGESSSGPLMGDLGYMNILSNTNRSSPFTREFNTSVLSLYGRGSLIGRSVSIYRPNSTAPMACAVIGTTNHSFTPSREPVATLLHHNLSPSGYPTGEMSRNATARHMASAYGSMGSTGVNILEENRNNRSSTGRLNFTAPSNNTRLNSNNTRLNSNNTRLNGSPMVSEVRRQPATSSMTYPASTGHNTASNVTTANMTSPAANMPSPAVTMTHPAANMTSPAANMTHPASNMTSPASSMTSPASNMSSPAANVTSPASSMTSPAANVTSPAVTQVGTENQPAPTNASEQVAPTTSHQPVPTTGYQQAPATPQVSSENQQVPTNVTQPVAPANVSQQVAPTSYQPAPTNVSEQVAPTTSHQPELTVGNENRQVPNATTTIITTTTNQQVPNATTTITTTIANQPAPATSHQPVPTTGSQQAAPTVVTENRQVPNATTTTTTTTTTTVPPAGHLLQGYTASGNQPVVPSSATTTTGSSGAQPQGTPSMQGTVSPRVGEERLLAQGSYANVLPASQEETAPVPAPTQSVTEAPIVKVITVESPRAY